MKLVGAVKRPEQIEFFLRRHGLWQGIIWTTSASWFSNPPDRQEAQPPENRRQKNSWPSGPQSYGRDKPKTS
jgi:hypothetical protein